MYIVTINEGYKDETTYQTPSEIMAKGIYTLYGGGMGGLVKVEEVPDREIKKQKSKK